MVKSFALKQNAWKQAQRPNYNTNIDLEYPYSECPYLNDYNLIKIPHTGLLHHVDYWGKGRVESVRGISGFKDSYNVNCEYQVVEDGEHVFKIPNRIPVASYIDCRTDNYIEDNSVKVVTLTDAPIYTNCAKDIARIVNEGEGIVVVYGINRNHQDVKNLDMELNKKNIVCCPGFELPQKLQGLTMFNYHVVFVNLAEYNVVLYKNIARARCDVAVAMCLELRQANQESIICEIFQRLFKEVNLNVMKLAYKLFTNNGYDLVIYVFLTEFQRLLTSTEKDIINQYYETALRLHVKKEDNIRDIKRRIKWRLIPQVDEEYNIEDLDVEVDTEGLKCWETLSDPQGFKYPYGEDRCKWALGPLRYNSDLLFFIINYRYQEGLKLAMIKNFYVDQTLSGNRGTFVCQPVYFGWLVKPI